MPLPLAQAYLLTRHSMKMEDSDKDKFECLFRIMDCLEADNLAVNPDDEPLFEGGFLAAFRRLTDKRHLYGLD